jgi:hypothetical protein
MDSENQNEPLVMNDKPMSAWEAAAAMGIDMSLIELNLSRTPAERFREHNRAMRLAWELREAMKKRNASS